MHIADLPLLDEHATAIAVGADEVWPALLETVEQAFSRGPAPTYARLVGCADSTADGPRPLAEGSTVPGFRVVAAIPKRELVLVGRHRFSSYALTLRVDQLGPGRSRLCVQSRAEFPGLRGRGYRLLVLGTGLHALAVRRLLTGVRRRAERLAGGNSRSSPVL